MWRVLDNEGRLWVRILKSRYGENPFLIERQRELRGGSSGRGLGSASGWWSDVCKIYWGMREEREPA